MNTGPIKSYQDPSADRYVAEPERIRATSDVVKLDTKTNTDAGALKNFVETPDLRKALQEYLNRKSSNARKVFHFTRQKRFRVSYVTQINLLLKIPAGVHKPCVRVGHFLFFYGQNVH